jgi:hypothetical protein
MLLWLAIVACLFFGFWGWVYQGYEEDAGRGAAQTWPVGAGGYLLGGALFVVLVRRMRPGMTPARTASVGLAVTIFLGLAAVLSIDAGNP